MFSSSLCRRHLALLPIARRSFNKITLSQSRGFHATRRLFDSDKEPTQIKQKRKEDIAFMLQNVRNWEKTREPRFESVPPLNSILAGFQQWLEQQGKSPLAPETVEAIKASYSILTQHQNWEGIHAENPFALFHASLNHALVLQDITLSDEQLEQIKNASASFKLLQALSTDTRRDVWKVYNTIAARNKEERVIETPIDTIIKALDLLSSLRNRPQPIPDNSTDSTATKSDATETPNSTSTSVPNPDPTATPNPNPNPNATPSPITSVSSEISKSISSETANQRSSPTTSSPNTSTSTPPASSASSPSSTPSTSETPKMPWLINVDVDSLGMPRKMAYFIGIWYRLAFSRFSAFSDFFPSRLLSGAYTAIQSFAESLNQGDLRTLRAMLSPPLYKHYENLLDVYRQKNIKLVLNMKPIEEGFITSYVAMQHMNPKQHDSLASLVPGQGPSMEELQVMTIRRRLTGVGYAFWQEPNDGTIEEGYDPSAHATRAEVVRAQISISFSVYANCKEVYYLKDSSGQVIEGSESTTENGHLFTFFTNMQDVEWKIVDMNHFNSTISDEVPLFQIEPEEHYLLMKSYQKNVK